MHILHVKQGLQISVYESYKYNHTGTKILINANFLSLITISRVKY